MNHERLFLAAGLALTAVCAPMPPPSHPCEQKAPAVPAPDLRQVRTATANMSSFITDLRATQGHSQPGAGRSAGDLWLEADRLKRAGQDVRTIEWLLCDLEGSLRRSPPDPSAQRHILNNLDYELEALKRRNR